MRTRESRTSAEQRGKDRLSRNTVIRHDLEMRGWLNEPNQGMALGNTNIISPKPERWKRNNRRAEDNCQFKKKRYSG